MSQSSSISDNPLPLHLFVKPALKERRARFLEREEGSERKGHLGIDGKWKVLRFGKMSNRSLAEGTQD